jgi:hypothetical protein
VHQDGHLANYGEYNKGCRLYDADIIRFVSDLQNAAYIFGNLQFTWDQIINDIVDCDHPGVSLFSPRTVPFPDQGGLLGWYNPSRQIWQQATANDPVGPRWDASAINIYFVGNVQAATGTAWGMAAVAVWPGWVISTQSQWTASFETGPPPSILVNDGGATQSWLYLEGWFPDDRLHLPGNPGYNEMPHEMAHYLGRFFGGPVLPTGSDYNRPAALGGGPDFHDWSTYPNYPNNVLRWGGVDPTQSPPLVFPLVVPGNHEDPTHDKGIIWQRIVNGTWNTP